MLLPDDNSFQTLATRRQTRLLMTSEFLMVHENLEHALQRHYDTLKAKYPNEGRRRWCLRVLYESWAEIPDETRLDESSGARSAVEWQSDPDPLDPILKDNELGLIIRTDFTEDDAWNKFCQTVQASQGELMSDLNGANKHEGSNTTEDKAMEESEEGDADSSDSSEVEGSPCIIKIIDPMNQAERLKITNISNITALRFFNDVDIRLVPTRPSDFKQTSSHNPLVDHGGWQEIYHGKHLWIYDARSNLDQCVRVVSQAGNFYGTATGDSWRARASHICELQFSIVYQGLKIDFNGLDRWDTNERARNLAEAVLL